MQRSELHLYLLHWLHAYPIALRFVYPITPYSYPFYLAFNNSLCAKASDKIETMLEVYMHLLRRNWIIISAIYSDTFNLKSWIIFRLKIGFFFRDVTFIKVSLNSMPNLEVRGPRWIFMALNWSVMVKKKNRITDLSPKCIFVFAPRRIYVLNLEFQ